MDGEGKTTAEPPDLTTRHGYREVKAKKHRRHGCPVDTHQATCGESRSRVRRRRRPAPAAEPRTLQFSIYGLFISRRGPPSQPAMPAAGKRRPQPSLTRIPRTTASLQRKPPRARKGRNQDLCGTRSAAAAATVATSAKHPRR